MGIKKEPIDYAKAMCDEIMNRYKPQDLPPKGVLFYHQGVFLSGMERVYKYTNEKKYYDYIKDYCDSVLGENGELIGFCHEMTKEDTPELAKQALTMLDHKQATIILYNIYDETGDEKYLKAIKTAGKSMYFWPVNRYGGYWHMMTQHNQMWLDGAYMAGPLSVMYAKHFGDTVLRERAINQIFIMDDFMKDEISGLYFHGWDDSKEMEWADPDTGLSSQIWGRAVGWYAVAILDVLEYIPKNHKTVPRLFQIERDLLKSLVKYQDQKTGLWYEVVDKPDCEGNWVESSCSCLFTYSYAKAVLMGIIDDAEFEDIIKKAYNGIIETSVRFDSERNIILDNICIGTCIDEGTYEHYIKRPIIQNDLHGSGAFVLMCEAVQNYLDMKK